MYSILDSRTIGDGFPVIAIPSDGLTGAGSTTPIYVDGIGQSIDAARDTRTNLILNEVLGKPMIVTVSLYEAGNRTTPIVEKEITLGPLEKVQLSSVFSDSVIRASTADKAKDRVNVRCTVSPKSGDGLVGAVVTTIDNQTGDTRNMQLTPNGGIAATGWAVIGF